MEDKEVLHIRISKELLNEIEDLVEIGLFSNKNEIIRGAIRTIILKYKDEVSQKK